MPTTVNETPTFDNTEADQIPTWEATEEVKAAEAPTWENTSEFPTKPEAVKMAVDIPQAITGTVNRLFELGAPSSEMAREQRAREANEQAQLRQRQFIAGGGPAAGMSLIPPGPPAAIARFVPTIPGRVLNAITREEQLAGGQGIELPKPRAFGETEEEYQQRVKYPLGAPGEPLYIPQTDNPSDMQRWASQASTLDDLLSLPIATTRTGGKVLLATMVPSIVEQVKSIAEGPGTAGDKLQKAKDLVIPLAIGVMATRPKGAELLPRRLGPEADIGTPVYPPLEFSGAALPDLPRGAVPRGRAAGPAGVGPGYPIVPRAAEPVGPQFPRRGAPIEVPETAAGPRETVLEEIRRNDARTTAQVQKLFPQLSREQAAVYRNAVWGKPNADVGVRVSPAVPRPSPMAPITPRAEAAPPAPRAPTTEEQIAAREAPEVAARRAALEQQIITWERELEFAQKRGDSRAQQQAVDKLLELRRQYEGPQPPAKPPITPKQPVPGVPRSSFPPEVPATAAEPRESVLAEIRRNNARTRAEIQRLFPARNLSGQEAAALRDQAWGKQPPGEPPAAPPAAPVPKEPTPPAPAAPAAEAAAPPKAETPAKPEIANRTTNENKNPLGDPMGTTYHATPDDWKLWQDVSERRKAIMQRTDLSVQQKFQQSADITAEIERIKNKYGGMPPKPPKPPPAPPAAAAPKVEPKPPAPAPAAPAAAEPAPTPKTADDFANMRPDQFKTWKQSVNYGDPTAREVTANFAEGDIRKLEASRDEHRKIVDGLQKELEAAKGNTAEQERIFKQISEHGLKAQTLNEFVRAWRARQAVPPAAPAAPAAPATLEETPIAGKTLGEWEKVNNAGELPKGTARAQLAKWLAVPNQPSRILQALANKKRTREIHAPFKPVEEITQQAPPPAAEPAPAAPQVEPTPAPPATEQPPAPETKPAETETKPPVSETKPTPGATKPAQLLFVKYGNRMRQVSAKEASEMMDRIRRETGEGASKLGQLVLYDAKGNPIGHVSYNGNVWYGTGDNPDLIHNATGLVKNAQGRWDIPEGPRWMELTDVQDKLQKFRDSHNAFSDASLAADYPEFAKLIKLRDEILKERHGTGATGTIDVTAESKPVETETKPAKPATSAPPAETPGTPPTAESVEKHLNLPVPPEAADARVRLRALDNRRGEVVKQRDALEAEIKALRRNVMTTRGSYGRPHVKSTAKKADVTRLRELEQQQMDLSRQIQTLDETSRADRSLVDREVDASIINDAKQPLLRRVDRLIRVLQNDKQQIPPELLDWKRGELTRIIKERYPDATTDEIRQMSPEVERAQYFGGDFWQTPTIPKPAQLRRDRLREAIKASPVSTSFSEELRNELEKTVPSIGAWPAAETLTAAKTEELLGRIQSETKSIQAANAKAEAERAAALAAEEAKQADLLKEAQIVADSAVRSGRKGGRSAKEVRDDLRSRIRGELESMVKNDEVTLRTNEDGTFTAVSGKGSTAAFGSVEDTGKGKFVVDLSEPGGDKVKLTVGSPEEAQFFVKAFAAGGLGKAVIGVPGDGVFRLNRIGSKMVKLYRELAGLDVSSGRGEAYQSHGGAQAPPSVIRTAQQWSEAKAYHGLEDGDKIYDWSPALREFAEKVQPENPEKLTVAQADKWVEEQLDKQRKKATAPKPTEEPPAGEDKMAGPGSPSIRQGPDPVVLDLRTGNPLWNRLQRGYQNFFAGVKQLWTRHPEKLDIMGLSNAAKNLPRIYGQQAGNSLRLGNTEADLKAATMVAQSLKMSGDGISVEDAERLGELEFEGDPIGYLREKQTDMEVAAQRFLQQGKKLEAAAALEAREAYRNAAANFNRLRPIAERGRAKLDRQFEREAASGSDTAYERWYVPQRHELDLFVGGNKPIVLGDSKGGGTGAQFKKAKFYEDYASAIEAGWIPRSLNLADLVEHRVASGERLLLNKGFFDSMREIFDPVDQKPVVMDIPQRTIEMPDGTTRRQETIPHGYTKHEISPGVNVAVHDGYARLVKSLTATSQLAESAVMGTLQNIAAVEKHLMLALDTFHLSRVLQAEFFLTGKMSLGARQRIGRALIEYSRDDIGRAVQAGEISQEMADYITTPRPMQVHGQTVNVSPKNLVMFGARQGLNIGRIGDALYRDWLRNVPISGAVNKFVFDKVSRSAIAHGFLSEFERVAAANPELTAAQVGKRVARDINVLFGNLQQESIFRNPSLRSLTNVLFLAPQWVESLARREARAVLQVGQAARDIPAAIREGRLPRLGTVGRTIGTALAGYFAGTQILNLITRGKFTFQNPEQGHKLDAWIPGGQNGFFISPLSVFGEITHDILRYAETKPDFATAVQQLGMNKLGPLGRFLYVLGTGRDPMTAEKIVGTGRRAISAAITAVPVPITVSQPLRAAGNLVAPNVISPPAPGAVQRQAMASAGFKTEPVGTAQSQVYRLADQWKSGSDNAKYKAEVERRLKEDFGPSDYRDLRSALSRGDMKAARSAYQELRNEGKTPKTIRQTLQHPHPFTGSKAAESKFKRSLDDEQRDLYDRALEERRELYRKLQQMLSETEPE